MNDNEKIAVLGGDGRQAHLASILARDGRRIYTFAVPGDICGVVRAADFAQAVDGCRAVVFPLPASKPGMILPCSESRIVNIKSILEKIEPKTLIFAGKTDAAFRQLCEERGLVLFDYYDDDSLTVKNAQLTAEAALSIFMNEKDIAVYGARVLVTGSGRVSKCVCRTFASLGASVTMMARSESELTWAELSGWNTVDLRSETDRLHALGDGYDVIINTIPVRFMCGCSLDAIREGTLVIDLASAPYGIDPDEAVAHGIKAHRAVSLPGKYAPKSAAAIIAEYIEARLGGAS